MGGIGSHAHKLILDTREFSSGAALARNELTFVKRALHDMRTPTEEYGALVDYTAKMVEKHGLSEKERAAILAKAHSELPESIAAEKARADAVERGTALNQEFLPVASQVRQKLADLKAAHAAGLVSQESYSNGVVQLRAQQLAHIPVIGQLASAYASLGPVGTAATAITVGLGVAIGGVSAAAVIAVRNIKDQIDKTDELINASQNVGLAVGEYERLAHATDLADIESRDFANGMEKMLGSVSKAADGSAKLEHIFAMLGLRAEVLRNQSPEKTFYQITEALDTIPNAADRVRAATAIFGSPDFLRVDTEHIARANALFDQMDAEITSMDLTNFDRMDSAQKELTLTLDLTWRKLALEVTPAVAAFAEAMTNGLTSFNRHPEFQQTLDEIGVTLEAIAITAANIKWAPTEFEIGVLKGFFAAIPGGGAIADAFGALEEQVNRGRILDEQMAARRQAQAQAQRKADLEAKRQAAEEARVDEPHDDAGKSRRSATAALTESAMTESDQAMRRSANVLEDYMRTLDEMHNKMTLSKTDFEVWKLQQQGIPNIIAIGLVLQKEKLDQQQQAIDLSKKEADAHLQAQHAAEKDRRQKQIGDHETSIKGWQQLANAGSARMGVKFGSMEAFDIIENNKRQSQAAKEIAPHVHEINRLKAEQIEAERNWLKEKERFFQREEQHVSRLVNTFTKDPILPVENAAPPANIITANKVVEPPTVTIAPKAVEPPKERPQEVQRDWVDIYLDQERSREVQTAPPRPLVDPRDPRLDWADSERARAEVKARLEAIRNSKDPFEDNAIRARLMSQTNERMFQQMETREVLNARLDAIKEVKAAEMEGARTALSERLNARTVTPQAPTPTISSATDFKPTTATASIVPQHNNDSKKMDEQTSVLKDIREKIGTGSSITVVEHSIGG